MLFTGERANPSLYDVPPFARKTFFNNSFSFYPYFCTLRYVCRAEEFENSSDAPRNCLFNQFHRPLNSVVPFLLYEVDHMLKERGTRNQKGNETCLY